MIEVKLPNGNILHLPDRQQRPNMVESPWEPCDCLVTLGNNFYFLLIGACLRADKKCNECRPGVQ